MKKNENPFEFFSSLPDIEEFGPGLVTGAADDDPSGIATYTVTGAQFGTQFLWTAWLTWPLMAFVQMMCAKIVIVTHQPMTALLVRKFPRWLVLTLILGLFAANTLNVAADLAGMGDALELLTGFNAVIFTVVLTLIITVMMIYLSYQQIARTLTWFTFFLLAYVFTALKADIHWPDVLRDALSPHLPNSRAGWATLVALLGTTISPYLFFWQAAQELEEVNQRKEQQIPIIKRQVIRNRRADVAIGTFVSNLIMFFVILTAASSLNRAGITEIESSVQAAEALKPLLGESASLIYTLGLLGVGLLAIPTLSGSAAFALSDYFKFKSGLNKKWGEARAFYSLIIISCLVALAINTLGLNPIRALFWSAVVNGLLSPLIIFAVLLVAMDSKIMKQHAVSRLSRIVVGITALLMTAAAVALFVL